MPSKKSGIKALKQSKKKQQVNIVLKKALKKEEKKIASLIAEIADNDVSKVKTELAGFFSRVDKSAARGIIHKNKASRKKARLVKKINKLATIKKKPAVKTTKKAAKAAK
ncbi:MAG: 30S ribosomal protein S20 [PVC group bacterium]|nr:30S ribosomal protein S20 [PVC group bacterium]